MAEAPVAAMAAAQLAAMLADFRAAAPMEAKSVVVVGWVGPKEAPEVMAGWLAVEAVEARARAAVRVAAMEEGSAATAGATPAARPEESAVTAEGAGRTVGVVAKVGPADSTCRQRIHSQPSSSCADSTCWPSIAPMRYTAGPGLGSRHTVDSCSGATRFEHWCNRCTSLAGDDG